MAVIRTLIDTAYEPGDPETDSGQSSHPWSVTFDVGGADPGDLLVGSSVFPPDSVGTRMARYYVRDGDTPPFGSVPRAEAHHGDTDLVMGSRTVDCFVTYFPSNYAQGDSYGASYRITQQFHEDYGSPKFATHAGRKFPGKLVVERKHDNRTGPFDSNRWEADISSYLGRPVLIIMQAKWSDSTDGYFHLWVDPASASAPPTKSWTGVTTVTPGGQAPYSKRGIYGSEGVNYGHSYKRIEVDDDNIGAYNADIVPSGWFDAANERTVPMSMNIQISSTQPPQVVGWSHAHVSNLASITLPAPTGTEVGDRTLIIMRFSTPPSDITLPSGMTASWTEHPDSITPDGWYSAVFIAEPLSSVGDMTFTVNASGGTMRGIRGSIRGGGTITLGGWDDEPVSTLTTDITAPSMTNPVANSRILNIWTFGDANSLTAPAGVTEVESYHEGFSTVMVVGEVDALQPSGATSAYTATLASAVSSATHRSMQVSLSPTPIGAPVSREVPMAMNISGRLERTVPVVMNVQTVQSRAVSMLMNVTLPQERQVPMLMNVSQAGIERTVPMAMNIGFPITVPVYPAAGVAKRR